MPGRLINIHVQFDRMELAAKLKTKAPVWQYFGLAVDEDGKIKSADEAICRLCNGSVMAKGGNTSN